MANPSYLNLPAIWNYGPTQSPPTTSDNAPVGAGKVAATQALMNSTATSMQAVFPSGDTTGATDTAAIQAALNQITSDTTGNQRLLMLFGFYYINATLTATLGSAAIQQQPFQILGYGQTTLNAVGSNFGILQIVTNGLHGFTCSDITFTYLTAQSTSNTASVCIGFRSAAGNDAGTMWDPTITRCTFNFAYRGIGNVQPNSSNYTTWGMWIQGNYFYGLSGAAIYLVPPSGAGGQPRINIIDNYFNYLNVACDTPTIKIGPSDCMLLMGNEWNSVLNSTLIELLNGATFSMIRNRVEVCSWTSNTNPPILISNGGGVISGFSFDNINNFTATNLYLISVSPGQPWWELRVSDIVINPSGTNSGTGTLTAISTGSGQRVIFENPINIYNNSLGSGPIVFRMCYSGGSTTANYCNWGSPPGGMVSADNGDTSITPNPITSAQVQVFNTPLTANRTVTLTATNGSVTADNCLDNTTFTILRTANSNDSNTLTVSAAIPATKVIATGTSATYVYNRALGGFVEIAAGAL